MPLVEVLNRYPARRERLRHWRGLIAATLFLTGVISLAAWRDEAVHGALLAFGISAGLLAVSWFASLVKRLLSKDLQIRAVRELSLSRSLEWLKRVQGLLTSSLQKPAPEEQPTFQLSCPAAVMVEKALKVTCPLQGHHSLR